MGVGLRSEAVGVRFTFLPLQPRKRHSVRGSDVLSFLWLLDLMCDTRYGQHLCGWGRRQSFLLQGAVPAARAVGDTVLCTRLLDASGLSMAVLDAS